MIRKKIGLLFSLSGTISVVGEGQLQAALLAIQENNHKSSIQFDPIIRDARSDPQVAAREALSLFKEAKIDALVGCYMSSVRNEVISVLNEAPGLLLYPTVYEGEQTHPNVFYLGAVPNQQVEPLLCWTFNNIGRNFVLVGSDYVYPRSTNNQVKKWVENAGGTVLSESYFPLGCKKFDQFFMSLKKSGQLNTSTVIFSTLVGESVQAFYCEHHREKVPTTIISPITSEREIYQMGNKAACGHICASPYFQSINSDKNERFVQAFRNNFGDQPICREMISTYGAIHLLSNAYLQIGGLPYVAKEANKLCTTLKSLNLDGPEGKVAMDPLSQHLWHWSHIGRINQKGNIEVIWSSPGPVPPKHRFCNIGISVRAETERFNTAIPGVLIGNNRRFLDCVRKAKIAAKTSANVLITGETGTGKDLLANLIHSNSAWADNKLVAINCANIPRELIESELFGYEEGAFTGAKKKGKQGKFELANGGTLFLDEIGEMPRDLQAHLLRVIEERKICRVGGNKSISLNFRLIAASNRDLSRELSEGGCFRRDLFFRISVFHIHLPLLRERKDDIGLLAEYFLQKLCRYSGAKKIFTAETMNILQNHEWPGNVRELANVVERCFYFSQDSTQICAEDLQEIISLGFPGNNQNLKEKIHSFNPTHGEESQLPNGLQGLKYRVGHRKINQLDIDPEDVLTLRETEKLVIQQALYKSEYNLSMAAKLLNIGRSTLYRKLVKHNINRSFLYGKSQWFCDFSTVPGQKPITEVLIKIPDRL